VDVYVKEEELEQLRQEISSLKQVIRDKDEQVRSIFIPFTIDEIIAFVLS